MLWGSREYDGLVLDFIGAFDLRGCIYNLRCPKDGRHRIRDANKELSLREVFAESQALSGRCRKQLGL